MQDSILNSRVPDLGTNVLGQGWEGLRVRGALFGGPVLLLGLLHCLKGPSPETEALRVQVPK